MSKRQELKISKLFSLREWLTVPEAAQHLSNVFSEEVSEAQVLRLSLDKCLKLSAHFVNHAQARRGEVVSEKEATWVEYSTNSLFTKVVRAAQKYNKHPDSEKNEPMKVMRSLDMGDGRFLNLSDNVTSIEGVWDLCMIGNEQLDIEHKYQMLTGGPEVTLTCLEGVFVERENDQVCILQDSFDKNEYQEGSGAQLENIKKYITKNNIEKEKQIELFNQHKQDRKEYLKKRDEKASKEDYYPASCLPSDSVLVVRTQALIDLQKRIITPELKETPALDPRAERTYLNIIGALLEITTGTFQGENFSSETQLRDFISEKFDDLRGVSTRTLADKFALAKKALNGEMD